LFRAGGDLGGELIDVTRRLSLTGGATISRAVSRMPRALARNWRIAFSISASILARPSTLPAFFGEPGRHGCAGGAIRAASATSTGSRSALVMRLSRLRFDIERFPSRFYVSRRGVAKLLNNFSIGHIETDDNAGTTESK
jgi:hypothetical protein